MSSAIEQLQDYLKEIVTGLISNPGDLSIETKEDDMGLFFTVKVNSQDIGKVIGKGGEISNAIRIVLRSAGMANGVRASMKVEVPGSKFQVER